MSVAGYPNAFGNSNNCVVNNWNVHVPKNIWFEGQILVSVAAHSKPTGHHTDHTKQPLPSPFSVCGNCCGRTRNVNMFVIYHVKFTCNIKRVERTVPMCIEQEAVWWREMNHEWTVKTGSVWTASLTDDVAVEIYNMFPGLMSEVPTAPICKGIAL